MTFASSPKAAELPSMKKLIDDDVQNYSWKRQQKVQMLFIVSELELIES